MFRAYINLKNLKLITVNLALTVTLSLICLYAFEGVWTYKEFSTKQAEYELLLERNKILQQGFEPPIFYFNSTDTTGELLPIGQSLGFFPLGLQPSSKILLCEEGYGWITYESDHLGYRNTKKDWDDFYTNRDLILIGDSFTHGFCVPNGFDTAGHLRKKGISVLNFGTASYNPWHYSALLLTFVPKLSPKNVALIFTLDNDFREVSSDSFNSFGKKNEGYQADNLSGKMKLSLSATTFFNAYHKTVKKMTEENLQAFDSKNPKPVLNLKEFLRLKKIRKVFWKDECKSCDPFICKEDSCMKSQFTSARIAIDSLNRTCNKSVKCNPIIILIGGTGGGGKGFGINPDSEPIRKEFNKIMKDYKDSGSEFAYFDLTPSIANLGERAVPRRGAHLSIEGYKLVSDYILTEIAEKTNNN